MRKFLFIACLLVPFLSCAQSSGTPIFSINNGIISTNNQFIDSFPDIVDSERFDIELEMEVNVVN